MKMKSIPVAMFVLAVFALTVFPQYEHEYADLTERELKYKDWTYQNVLTGEEVNLRNYARDKKLVLIFYFAPWCHSSSYQMPVTQRLHEKYAEAGLGVIGVSLYAETDRTRKKLESERVTFPVVVESTTKFRTETPHYKYRKKTGDERKWGTPYNVFLVPSELREKGETLTKRAVVVNGEIREEEAESYIRRRLGLPPLEKESSDPTGKAGKETTEECSDEESALKKPSR